MLLIAILHSRWLLSRRLQLFLLLLIKLVFFPSARGRGHGQVGHVDRADWVGGVVDAQYVNQLCDPLEIFDRWIVQDLVLVSQRALCGPISPPCTLFSHISALSFVDICQNSLFGVFFGD